MKIHVLDLGFLEMQEAIAVFVVEGPSGLALVETGPYSTFPHLEEALQKNGFRFQDIQDVFLTHIHFDHAGAAWALAEKGIRIHVHPIGLPHMAAPEKLYNSAKMIYGDQMERLWGIMKPIDEALLIAPKHGQEINSCGLKFTAYYTPGHASHHIAWKVDAPDSDPVIFTGDVAGVRIGKGPVMPPCPPPDIHIESWQASIQLLRDLPVQSMYLTHFGLVENKEEILIDLEKTLLSWASWMRPYYLANAPAETIIPKFEAYVQAQLQTRGLDAATLARYEAANPAYMSVAGLMRYWKKKLAS